ncbi:MAG: phosphotyrosine protein phosphatase [Alphaproteobacteria bacterium HGW-Alphaproteobacteria-16]|nr:MAG: phosphotyrosine protein phosphatase [Alphaproteobacteria bacterium HGW-Alphaproteobacteria-16]
MHAGGDHITSVLFVCLGNICRSPMAEGAFRAAAAQSGLDCHVDSAGTASYHIGDPPDPRAIAVARSNGVDIAGLTARQLKADDFYRFTHVIALDRANLEGIKAHAPRDGTATVALLLDAVNGREGEPVPDPYYGDSAAFEAAWQIITEGAQALVRRLASAGSDPVA